MKLESRTESRPTRNASVETRHLNLALQGGGAHGAFTWGVLDRLLDDERLVFDGISATSAGAMNATVMVYGYQQGGRAGPGRRSAISGGGSRMPRRRVRSRRPGGTRWSATTRSTTRRLSSGWIS